jgi:hypothetical protein
MYIDTTAIQELQKLFELDKYRAAEVRTAADLIPKWDWELSLPESLVSSSSGRDLTSQADTKMSPWLQDAMASIEKYRNSAPPDARLDDAENIASLLADSIASRRPQLNMSEDGIPSFATSVENFYIHITIDRPHTLTWFAMTDGREYFAEDVPFDGRGLPQEIRELLYA